MCADKRGMLKLAITLTAAAFAASFAAVFGSRGALAHAVARGRRGLRA